MYNSNILKGQILEFKFNKFVNEQLQVISKEFNFDRSILNVLLNKNSKEIYTKNVLQFKYMQHAFNIST